MKNLIKFLFVALATLTMLIGTALASPINVEDVKVQEINGEYMVLVSLNNLNVASGTTSDLVFTIEELGVSKKVNDVRVDSNVTEVLAYNLKDVVESYESLKKGNSYQITVESDSNSVVDSFLFGTEKTTEGLDLILENVKVNSEDIDGDVLSVMNGENVEVQLRFSAEADFDNARISVFIEGYEHSTLVDTTEIFAVKEGKTYIKTLNIALPEDMNSQESYKLRIIGANDLSGITYKDYELYVDTARDRVDVLDLVMTPSSGVEPGQNIIANVRMKNRGQQDQDSVKVLVEIEELGVKESSYVSNLNSNEVATSDDMLLFVPEDAKAGQYTVKVTLSYDDGYESSFQEFNLNVLDAKTIVEKNLLVSFKNNIDLVASEENTFTVVVANPNTASKPISLVSMENAWADVEVSPSLAMVKAGEDVKFTVTVSPKDAVSGEKTLTLNIKEGTNQVSEISVSTYVAPSDSINWVNVALAVLLIVAIIVLLALVVSIAKRRGNNDEDEVASNEEYY